MTTRSKSCCIQHIAAHYRRDIFMRMDRELNCHFVFGEQLSGGSDITPLSGEMFRNFDFCPKNRIFLHRPFSWQTGIWKLLFRDYNHYFVQGDIFCVSTWLLALGIFCIPGKKLFFWTHGWYGKENRLRRTVKKLFFSLADGFLLYGDYARKLMIAEGFPPEKLFVIHNSLCYEEQRALCDKLVPGPFYRNRFHNDHPVIVFVGRLTRTKRLDLILDAMKILASRGVFPNLALIGDGEAREELALRVRREGLDGRIWFLGACYDEAILSEYLYHADVCVSPGNVGLTAIHAMTFGCPVVTHDNFSLQMPEFEAIRPGVTGDFFQYQNAGSLAETLLRWWERNRKCRDTVREACRKEIAEKWNPHHQMNVLKEVLQ